MNSPEQEKAVTVHCVGNAHVDPVWLWSWPDGLDAVLMTYAAALDRIAENMDFHFSCSAAATYAWVEEVAP